MADDATFGALLRQYRLAAGLTQEALAERAGLSADAVSTLERGTRQAPHKDTVTFLVHALRLAPAERERLAAAAPQGRGPAAHTAPATWIAIPTPLTSFVGRELELATLRRLLLEARLVTLTGSGGVGKTRLALAMAGSCRADFPDGVCFVALAPVTDPELVLSTIARALGLRETAQRTLLDVVQDYLRTKQSLLVLDNFEHVVAAAPTLTKLLAACPGLKVLATSRERLHIYGEREYRVPLLAFPPLSSQSAADFPADSSLGRYPAVQLFVDRAVDARADFTLTNENAPAVTEICRRLDGLPLAIELAAARVTLLSPQAILVRMERRLPLLVGGPRDRAERQQTLRATIAWSYDLLDEEERRLFQRLSVFIGGCTLAAAEVVGTGTTDPRSALDTVASLVDKSLLLQEADDLGEVRVRMLETVREFARERLLESVDVDAPQHLHAGYFADLGERAEPHLTSAGRWAWLAALDREYDNIRAALTWCTTGAGDVATGWRLAGTLSWYWYYRSYVNEGRRWSEALLAAGDATPGTVHRAKVLFGAGGLAWLQGDHAVARGRLEESLAIFRKVANRQHASRALTMLGMVLASQGEFDAARSRFDEGLALVRKVADKWWEAFTLNALGDVAMLTGQLDAARSTYAASLAAYKALEDPWGQGMLLNALGSAALAQGDPGAARALFEESMAYARAQGDKRGIAQVLWGLGDAAVDQGTLDGAAAAFAEALTLWWELGSWPGISYCLAGFAKVAAAQGNYERAVRLFGATGGQYRTVGIVSTTDPHGWELAIAAVRAHLDPSMFDAAWKDGQAMTQEQARAFALAKE